MPTRTFSSREFNQHPTEAKKASNLGPVFITDRGKPAHVILTIDEYERLTKKEAPSIADLLSVPEDEDFDIEIPKADIQVKPVDFD
ncbi:type II toxin-antitoxin system Phd/YefM family antitoxin [Endozoicomonas sp. SM1973]|uniref:Antitoxin n=1 Tax=Spartinivicinus marinus TaxID=2994442 RepID=A0A853IF19_9GAMM|nr:type II toxin-antitoxin system prevent-host-death family antitoxin [Spartinivicinus marinus]NYZ69128.1 type II toxin-antitoxin system Phd/YefM family antitoxin [Spartinivicinus marinus]